MDLYIVTLTILGVVVLLTAWLPMVMKRLPLSLPIACLAIGALLAWSPYPFLPLFNPLENGEFTERMTEIFIRGLGSIYYLAYATGHAEFENIQTVWATVLLIVLVSIVVHGIAVTPAMRWIDGRRSRASRKPPARTVS
ncbi:hypothetical protein PMI07_004795 [Rhizobium sp. CF080]|uniref:hypothetical protein n=1 Tax=Rhizobium sp. (strain CF080) TaxID=1144310 RepID=UPI000271D57F|nr:hypothetical protein [Rhizobium sp. CF080]EUB98514.1 hypothetical protein PMI07_004795 [Rhizobium sp. CF080]